MHPLSSSSVDQQHITTTPSSDLPAFLQNEEDDAPQPTENGGFTHTAASRAKISAANKGKTPWNKGRQRSEETKARIAAGVRARNRERFLQKLKEMGLTEDQYTAQKKEERRKKDAEKRARRTSKGGYRPTEETKQKISKILKQKYATGEVKRRPIDPSKVRRGFTHSPETRQKISESLRQRWATDPDYRERMVQASNTINNSESTRQKISESLRRKWKDPEFRARMMKKIANRSSNYNNKDGSEPYQHNEEHRQKISAAMKAKWQDEEYRQKAVAAIAKRKSTMVSEKKTDQTRNYSGVKSNSRKTLERTTKRSQRNKPEQQATLGGGAVRVVQPLAEPREKKNRRVSQ